MVASYASHSWAALWQTVSRTDRRSVRERATTPRISLVVLCWSCASCSSQVSRATSVSWPEADELLWRTAFGAFALRLRALASLLLALERRRIAHPQGLGLRRYSKSITAGICGRRNGVQGFNLRGSNLEPLVSALGRSRHCCPVGLTPALPPEADIDR